MAPHCVQPPGHHDRYWGKVKHELYTGGVGIHNNMLDGSSRLEVNYLNHVFFQVNTGIQVGTDNGEEELAAKNTVDSESPQLHAASDGPRIGVAEENLYYKDSLISSGNNPTHTIQALVLYDIQFSDARLLSACLLSMTQLKDLTLCKVALTVYETYSSTAGEAHRFARRSAEQFQEYGLRRLVLCDIRHQPIYYYAIECDASKIHEALEDNYIFAWLHNQRNNLLKEVEELVMINCVDGPAELVPTSQTTALSASLNRSMRKLTVSIPARMPTMKGMLRGICSLEI